MPRRGGGGRLCEVGIPTERKVGFDIKVEEVVGRRDERAPASVFEDGDEDLPFPSWVSTPMGVEVKGGRNGWESWEECGSLGFGMTL